MMNKGGRGGGRMTYDKATNFKYSMSKLLNYILQYRGRLILVFALAILSSLFTLVGPKILINATNEIVRGAIGSLTGTAPGIDFSYILRIVLFLLILYTLSAVFGYLQSWIMSGVTSTLAYSLRKDLLSKINKLPVSYYDQTSFGNVLSRVTNDVDALTNNLHQGIIHSISAVTTLVGVFIMMLSISLRLTLVALLIIPLMVILVTFIIKRSQVYFRKQQGILGELNGKVEEDYSGHNIIKAFNQEEDRYILFQEVNDRLYDTAWKAQFFSGIMMPMTNFVSNLAYVFIVILGATMTAQGTLTIGEIQAFIQYVRSFTQPISQIGNITNQMQLIAAAAERIFKILDEEKVEDSPTAPEIKLDELVGDIEFKNVSFTYENSTKPVLKNFNATVKAGQKVAIVGPTGSGKTTIVKLLMRFHDVTEGAIEFDGHNIKDFSREDLRDKFSMVLQDTWLFNGTIMDNIKYGNTEASTEEAIKAAETSQVDTFIDTLPHKYDTVINEEADNISQGQKQLLTIARSMLADSEVLILDEATSSVDTRTEVLIQKAMDSLTVGRTSFIIAHRLSTIKNADLILVIRDGELVEQGSHDELMELQGDYASMYNSQFK